MSGGYHIYRLEGKRIYATPWAVPHMTADVVRFMVAELLLIDVTAARIAAEGKRGPFVAHVLDYVGRGATPLDALRAAVDVQQRNTRARARALP